MRGITPPTLGLKLAAPGLILVFFLLIVSESCIKSPTTDEPPHIASGLAYVAAGVFRANPQHPPLLKELSAISLLVRGIHLPRNPATEQFLYGVLPPGVQPEWAIGNQVISQNGVDTVLFWARLPLILIACLGAVLLYLWGRQLMGRAAAISGLFLFILDPTILAHSFLVTTDVGVAVLTMLFLFTLWNYLHEPGWKRLTFCGLALGAALCTKFSAVLLLPIALVLLLAGLFWPAESRLGSLSEFAVAKVPSTKPKLRPPKQRAAGARQPSLGYRVALSIGAFPVMCTVAFIVIQAVYFFPLDPLEYYRGFKLVNADHNPNYMAYLGGGLKPRFPSYFASAYLLKEPLAAIILAAAGLAALLQTQKVPRIAKLFLLLPPFVWVAAISIAADDLGIRYIIPVLPFGHLLGGFGLASLLQMPAKWGRGAAVVLCGWLILAAAGIYPDHLSYFNEAACLTRRPSEVGLDGGTRCGTLWLDDSNVDWGQGLKQLKSWMDRNAPGRTIRLANAFGFPADVYGIAAQDAEREIGQPPSQGLYVVSAHLVARVPFDPGATDWLRTTRPTAIVGHALYLYDTSRKLEHY